VKYEKNSQDDPKAYTGQDFCGDADFLNLIKICSKSSANAAGKKRESFAFCGSGAAGFFFICFDDVQRAGSDPLWRRSCRGPANCGFWFGQTRKSRFRFPMSVPGRMDGMMNRLPGK
jgi:hypothetical protein